jgi:hypothetical protein
MARRSFIWARNSFAARFKGAGTNCFSDPKLRLGVLIDFHPITVCAGTRRRGRAAETPVNQLSNSIGESAGLSNTRGNNNRSAAAEANPGSQVVAETTPASFSHGRKARR